MPSLKVIDLILIKRQYVNAQVSPIDHRWPVGDHRLT
jgi:hypothetical protein